MKEITLSVIYDFGNRRTVTKRGAFDDHLDYLATLSPVETANLTLVNRDELNSDEKYLLESLREILKSFVATQYPGDIFDKQGECMCSMEYSPCSCPKDEPPMVIDPRHPRYANAVPQWIPREMFDGLLFSSQLLGGSRSESEDDDCNCEEDGFCFHDDVEDVCDSLFGCNNCEPTPVMPNEPNVNILSNADIIRRIARNRVLETLRDKINEALTAEDFNGIVTFHAGNWLRNILEEKGYDYSWKGCDDDILEFEICLAGFEG
jgi:hypothetical protein